MIALRPAMTALLLACAAGCAAPTSARPAGHLSIEILGPAGQPATVPPVATPTPLVLPDPPGTPVEPGFYKGVEPPYRVGTTWRRRVASEGNSLIDITEVLAVSGNRARLRQHETREDGVEAVAPREFEVPLDGNPLAAALPSGLDPNGVPLKVGLVGYEDVTVPAGTYPHCAKVGIAGLDVDDVYLATAWLADGVGVVKLVATRGGGTTVTSTQELLSITP